MKSQYIFIFIILALASAVYSNTLHNVFVSDDLAVIVNNPEISKIFPITPVSNLVSLSFSLDYLMGKLNPAIYHATNILIHAVCCVLVFFFLRLFFKPQASFWGSLIFAVHPVHTEAVTWISGRPHSLSALWMLAALLLYARATSADKLSMTSFLCSVFFCFLAMFTSPLTIIFPALLVLYDFCRPQPESAGSWEGWGAAFRGGIKNWRLWLAFLALALVKLLYILGVVKIRVNQVSLETGHGFYNPLFIFNMAYSVFGHLSLLLWPAGLTFYHEPPLISRPAFVAELCGLAILILSLPFIFKKSRVIFFSIILFVLFLLPTYSPVMMTWLVAERYLYFPSVALCMWMALLIEKTGLIKNQGKAAGIWADRLVIAILLVLVAGYSVRTIIRNRDWYTHASLWQATLAVSPYSHQAHNNMGDVYYRQGDFQKAAGEFSQAAALKPNFADAYNNLANAYQMMGRWDEAILNYEKAAAINPRQWQSYENLGVIYYNRGLLGLAKEYLLKAQGIVPDNPQIRELLGIIASLTK